MGIKMEKDRILELLRSAGADRYLSGQELSEKLGVSRTAVWKAVTKLREEGYPIEAVRNRGYRLDGSGIQKRDILNGAELELRLRTTTKWVGHPCYYTEETGSTNDDIMALADQGAPEGTLCVASRQTRGKGRRGRTWISPNEGNVYMSLLVRPEMATGLAPMVTIVMALAACQACQEVAGRGMDDVPDSVQEWTRFGIKWPNDIVISTARVPAWKKVTGILTEMRLEEQDIRDVTIGIGININMPEIPEEIADTASSILLATGRITNRADLVAAVWKYFEQDYEKFRAAGSLAPLKEAYESVLVNRGRGVRVLDPQQPFTGTAIGISDSGELLVRPDAAACEDRTGMSSAGAGAPETDAVKEGQLSASDRGAPETGEDIRRVSAGEVSVRGVEGYV